MIVIRNSWEIGKICVSIVGGVTSRFTKISDRGEIAGTVYTDLSLIEAQELAEELQKVVGEFKKEDKCLKMDQAIFDEPKIKP